MSTTQSTIKPVTIPREVADAIESYRLHLYTNDKLALLAFRENGHFGRWMDDAQVIRDYAQANVDDFMSALVNGYERELSEIEVRELAYDELRAIFAEPPQSEFSRGFDSGLLFTLNTLGIVIDGINEGGAA